MIAPRIGPGQRHTSRYILSSGNGVFVFPSFVLFAFLRFVCFAVKMIF